MADPTRSRRSSIASRRTLRRQSSRLSTASSALDIFSDDHAADFNPVADGFSPGQNHDTNARPSTPPTHTSTPQLPPRAASPPRVTEYLKKRLAAQERNTVSIHRSSLSTTRREPTAPLRNASMSVSSEGQGGRPLSSVSGLSTPVSENPYNVSGGPSHPYAMYPQLSSLNRTASTSTVQTQGRTYNGPSRPTHPYAMYPQIPGSQSELIDPFSDPADIANVGFPGLGQSYARRLGPDGEEADDLIGPDGHTEQLPPYSRYPDDLPPKQRAEIEDSRSPLLGTSTLPAATSPSEPHPEMSQSESLLDNEEGTMINQGAARAAGLEELNRTARWKEKGKRRTCWGKIPVWAWIVLVVILCMLAATLGAVVGKYVAHPPPPPPTNSSSPLPATTAIDNEGKSPPPTTVWQTLTTTLVDATPISGTPMNLQPLPTGTFAVPIQDMGNGSDNCLRDSAQKPGWSCNKQSFLSLSVQAADPSTSLITLFAEYPEDFPLLYGAQAPTMRGPAVINLMRDLEDLDAGPAYYFQQLYDKLIIVQGSQLESVAKKGPIWKGKQRRSSSWIFGNSNTLEDEDEEEDEEEDGDWDFSDGRLALPRDISWSDLARRDYGGDPVVTGDQPWYCFWNSTILEGFIYANHNSTPPASETQYVASVAADSMMTGAPTLAWTGNGPPPLKRGYERRPEEAHKTPPPPSATSSIPGVPNSVYPRVVKIEERRSIGMPQPYCQQMNALRDGTIVPLRDPNGGKIRFNLSEVEPIVQHNLQPNNSRDADNNQSRRGIPVPVRDIYERDSNGIDMTCRCQWVFK